MRSYQKQIQREPLNGHLCSAYGKMLFRMGLAEYSLLHLRRAVALNSADGEVYCLLCEIYEKLKDGYSLHQTLREGAEKHKDCVPLLVRLSDYCLSGGDYEGAYRYAEAGLRLEKNSALHYNVGLYYFRKEQDEPALTHFLKSIELDPQNYKAYNCVGNVYRRKRMFGQAFEAYQNCEKLASGTFPVVFLNLACIYLDQKDVVLAANYFVKAEAAEKDKQGVVHAVLRRKGYDELAVRGTARGVELFCAQDYAGAIKELQENYSPTGVVGNFYLGQAYDKLQQRDDALAYFRQILVYALCERDA